MKSTVSNEEIASLCLELSMLLHAGVGMGDALSLLAEAEEYREALAGVAEQADDGASLSAALRSTGRFPVSVCGLLEVGERTGRVEEALKALSTYYEDRVRMGRRIKSALLYPAVMLALMLVVIAVLLVKVLPIFDDVYASLGGRLTGVAGGLLRLGRWIDGALPVLWVLLAALALGALAFAAAEPFRVKALSWWRRHHGDKGVSRKLNNARFAQAMAMAMASGLPPEEALNLSGTLMEAGARERCQACQDRVDQGTALGEALQAGGFLTVNQCRLLDLGRRSGAEDASMEKIARDLSEESEAALENLVSRVEPSLVLVCSVLTGLILLSVMLPLMHIMAAIG